MLEVINLSSFYGDIQVLYDVSLQLKDHEAVALFGPNGHGKSTLLKAISAVHLARSGQVIFNGRDITHLPAHKIVGLGIAYIPEERFLFPEMSVQENLNMGAYNLNARKNIKDNLEFVFYVFPKLKERRKQIGSTLSGGESRMIAIARGLMSNASILLVDEPSIGLSPALKHAVFEAIEKINKERGITILIVEQEIEHTLRLAQRVYLLKKGRILFERSAKEVDVNEIAKAYF